MKNTHRSVVASLATIVALAAVVIIATPANAVAQAEETMTRLYEVRNVSLSSAATLARSVCEDVWRDAAESGEMARCEVAALEREDMLAVTAASNVHSRIVMLLNEFDTVPRTRSFHIVVLAASRTGSIPDELPEGARDALADIQEFLPYSGFRVVGNGWVRTHERAETALPGSMELSTEIRFRPSSDPSTPILIEGFYLYLREPERLLPNGELKEADLRVVLGTSFSIYPGETVVVGTSRLNGDDEALVVLLTVVDD